MVSISKSAAIEWLKTNGLTDEWEDLTDFQKGMVGIEAITHNWDILDHAYETGIPQDGVALYFKPEHIGINIEEAEEAIDLTAYVVQNTESSRLKMLFEDDTVNIIDTKVEDECIRVECKADTDILS